ncbi:MAG: sulfotransferase [Cyanobacteria bacterium P01_D01_bin.44]
MNFKLQNEPFFIIGCGRSGTTMLRLMLNDHPGIRVPRETPFLPRLMQQLPLNSPLSEDDTNLAFNLITNHWKWETWAVTPERLRNTISSLKHPFLGQLISAMYLSCSNPENKPRWGDKSIACTQKVHLLHQVFPHAKFIHLIRDARDVCMSWQNAYLRSNSSAFKHGQSISDAAKHWSHMVNAAVESGQHLGSEFYLEIRYEDLVLKTEETLKNICTFIGEEYDSRMLDFYKNSAVKEIAIDKPHHAQHHTKTRRPPNPTDTYRWRAEMSLADIVLVEAHAGQMMDRIGQTRHFQGMQRIIPYSFRASCKLKNKLEKILLPTNED